MSDHPTSYENPDNWCRGDKRNNHTFEPRYNEGMASVAPWVFTNEGHDAEQTKIIAIAASESSNREYVCDVCVYCGKQIIRGNA